MYVCTDVLLKIYIKNNLYLNFIVNNSFLIYQTSLSTPGSANLPLLKAGAELGVYTFLGFAFQSIGLESTTASRSAFLLYLNVKIVPFLSAVFYRRAIPLTTWISAFLALCGLNKIHIHTYIHTYYMCTFQKLKVL